MLIFSLILVGSLEFLGAVLAIALAFALMIGMVVFAQVSTYSLPPYQYNPFQRPSKQLNRQPMGKVHSFQTLGEQHLIWCDPERRVKKWVVNGEEREVPGDVRFWQTENQVLISKNGRINILSKKNTTND